VRLKLLLSLLLRSLPLLRERSRDGVRDMALRLPLRRLCLSGLCDLSCPWEADGVREREREREAVGCRGAAPADWRRRGEREVLRERDSEVASIAGLSLGPAVQLKPERGGGLFVVQEVEYLGT